MRVESSSRESGSYAKRLFFTRAPGRSQPSADAVFSLLSHLLAASYHFPSLTPTALTSGTTTYHGNLEQMIRMQCHGFDENIPNIYEERASRTHSTGACGQNTPDSKMEHMPEIILAFRGCRSVHSVPTLGESSET